MTDTTYIPKVYREPGGDRQVVASGGEVLVESGGTISIESGASINIETGASVQADNIVKNIRTRFTIAQVNAGATLLAASAGYKYRMVACKAISVGGAAGATTTVDILGTQTSAVKLVAFAQASLTQSAVLTAGGTGAAVLADGASFVACDSGAAVTVGKTGSAVTTATHIDIIFDYVIEAA